MLPKEIVDRHREPGKVNNKGQLQSLNSEISENKIKWKYTNIPTKKQYTYMPWRL